MCTSASLTNQYPLIVTFLLGIFEKEDCSSGATSAVLLRKGKAIKEVSLRGGKKK